MPQMDLETLVSSFAGVSCDNKVACETLSDHHPLPETDSDPPASFRLSKDAEREWYDQNALVYERKDSTKGNVHPNHVDSTRNPNPVSSSQRFAHLKSKAFIIGLPKNQKTAYAEAKNRRNITKPGNIRLFPKRSGWTGKPVESSLVEPTSPKVSCMGRVKSRRDRNRRLRNRQRSKRSTDLDTKTIKETKKKGFLDNFCSVFRRKKPAKGNNGSARGESFREPPLALVRTIDIRERLPACERDAPPRKSVDGDFGGMKRFSSGRRTIESLGVDVA